MRQDMMCALRLPRSSTSRHGAAAGDAARQLAGACFGNAVASTAACEEGGGGGGSAAGGLGSSRTCSLTTSRAISRARSSKGASATSKPSSWLSARLPSRPLLSDCAPGKVDPLWLAGLDRCISLWQCTSDLETSSRSCRTADQAALSACAFSDEAGHSVGERRLSILDRV